MWWGRFIDDVILIWSGSEIDLLAFHSYLNTTNIHLNLSLDFSFTQIHFLDLKIFKDNEGKLHTTIFRKETDRNAILRADRFNPSWLTDNIPFGQFQRLKRIYDKEEDFDIKAQDMIQRFKERGYKNSVIENAYYKAKNINRDELLVQRQKLHNTVQRQIKSRKL